MPHAGLRRFPFVPRLPAFPGPIQFPSSSLLTHPFLPRPSPAQPSPLNWSPSPQPPAPAEPSPQEMVTLESPGCVHSKLQTHP